MDPQNSPPQPQPQPTEPVTPQTLPPFSLPIIIGVLLFILIVGVGVFYLGKKQTIQPPVTNLIPTTSTLVPTIAQDGTINWKTYINNGDIKFEVKYPSEWMLKQGVMNEIRLNALSIRCYPRTKLFDPYKNEPNEGGYKVQYYKKITINGFQGNQYLWGQVSDYGFLYTQLINKNNTTNCEFMSSDFVVKNHDFDQSINSFLYYKEVISSFKFLDQEQADETENWEIYKNDKFGYEIKYPKVWKAVEAKPRIGFNPEWTGNILIDNEVQKITFVTTGLENFEFNFEVKVSSNPANLSIEELKNKILNETVAASGAKLATFEKTIKLDNLDALKFSIFAFDSGKNLISTINNNYIYKITFDEKNPNDPYFETHFKTYNEMLSSFKFLE